MVWENLSGQADTVPLSAAACARDVDELSDNADFLIEKLDYVMVSHPNSPYREKRKLMYQTIIHKQ